jgi:hypothetical protein
MLGVRVAVMRRSPCVHCVTAPEARARPQWGSRYATSMALPVDAGETPGGRPREHCLTLPPPRRRVCRDAFHIGPADCRRVKSHDATPQPLPGWTTSYRPWGRLRTTDPSRLDAPHEQHYRGAAGRAPARRAGDRHPE